MATTIRVDAQPGGRVLLRWPYEPTLVNLIKTIPASRRSWDAANKAWRLERTSDAADFLNAARQLGHAVVGSEWLTGGQRGSSTAAQAPTSTVDVFRRLFDLVGPTRGEQTFRALTKVLHPDRETGDTELMQALNQAREGASL